MSSSKTCLNRTVWLVALAVMSGVTWGRAAEPPSTAERRLVTGNALEYLRARQDAAGAFGTRQPHLQTAVALLAFLSADATQTEGDRARLEKGVRYLTAAATAAGALGDDEFATESHALALTALLCAWPQLEDAALREETSKVIHRALRLTQRWQDRSSSAASRGGWKMDGGEGKQNDRRASTWTLLSLQAARLYGLDVKDANFDRGADFVLASFKPADSPPDQRGGLSVDAEGLSVAMVSAMGGWLLQHAREGSPEAALNRSWLMQHPATWSGPNYFYANFFRVRALQRADPGGEDFHATMRQLLLQIREHQQQDGSVDFPPGNAQNTIAMGATYSTAMAALILSADNSALVFDEDFRVMPLF